MFYTIKQQDSVLLMISPTACLMLPLEAQSSDARLSGGIPQGASLGLFIASTSIMAGWKVSYFLHY